jgi:hypothetical protein
MVFFHQFKNYINRDPLSDWFSRVNRDYDIYTKDIPNEFQIELQKKTEIYKKEFIKNLRDNNFFYENINHNEIIQKIRLSEECIIYNGTLYHSKYKIYVKPDLIIHRNLFQKYFPEVKIDLPEYIIIDILFKILHFNSDKTDLLNQGNIYYHKCKMFIASSCLGIKDKGYFFGKEYRYKNVTLCKKENIGFFPFLPEYNQSVRESIEWLDKLEKNYQEWSIFPKPSIKELYPNMNRKDGEWTEEKKNLAEKIKEITLVWNISYNKRCILLDKGIFTWDDPTLLSNIYPYKIRKNKRELIQEKIIHINSQNNILIEPRKIKNYDFLQVIKNKKDSIILDIESVIKLQEKQSYFNSDIDLDSPRICIIGTIINNDNDYIYKDFTIRFLTNDEEEKIIKYWVHYLKRNFKNKIKVYHWGNAEKVYIDYMKIKYPKLDYPEFELIDLLYYFKLEPINIKGCFGYGLKEIVKQLYALNLIEDTWEDNTNGLDAMIQILKTSEEAEIKNIPIKRFHKIKKIIYYNYMDCKVINDILKMLDKMILF